MVTSKKTRKARLTQLDKMALAFQRAVYALERSTFADPYRYCDYSYNLNETLTVLNEHLSDNEYRPKRAENFDMPKGEYAIRPGAIIDILDLTVLNRIIADFIFKLEDKLPAGATAYRVRKDRKMDFRIEREAAYFVLPRYKRNKISIEEEWYNLWPQYRKKLVASLKSGLFPFVATTDITAYFEDVNLLTLGEILKRKAGRGHLEQINILVEILQNWALRDPSNIRQNRGLPQNVSISGVLSNYYLDIVDSYLEDEKQNGKVEWYRYCDDIHVLCKTRGRAKVILLNIGKFLRILGLNQNAEKTKILSDTNAIDVIQNEHADKVSSIIEQSRKKGANINRLVKELRDEYGKISKRKNIDRKIETSIFRTYTAALRFDMPILIRRVGPDFLSFPARAKHVCTYARHFVNSKPVLRSFSSYLDKKVLLLLYNFQVAYLVSIFRNLKKADKKIFKHILNISFDTRWHWYVRVQAISTLFYLGNGYIRLRDVKKLLDKKNHRYIRRAALTLIPLCCNSADAIKLISDFARELNITVSRMANFILELTNKTKSTLSNLNKFYNPNHIYLGDQIWQLWFISLNKDKNVQKSLDSKLKSIKQEFRNYPVVLNHIKQIIKFKERNYDSNIPKS